MALVNYEEETRQSWSMKIKQHSLKQTYANIRAVAYSIGSVKLELRHTGVVAHKLSEQVWGRLYNEAFGQEISIEQEQQEEAYARVSIIAGYRLFSALENKTVQLTTDEFVML